MSLWNGRFKQKTNELSVDFSESVSYDQRLYAHDIRASITHVRMLARAGIIPVKEKDSIVNELNQIKKEIDAGGFQFSKEYEDVHMNIERYLIDKLGERGARVHTARSRNDQVATDVRLYVRDEIQSIVSLIEQLQVSLISLSERHHLVIMPGLTHLQHAQPVLFSHHLLAYTEMFQRDKSRLEDCKARLNYLPLGAGALAGTTLSIDRDWVASELGFDGIMRNSMDAVSDRDFAIELLAGLSIFMMHISRISEDIIFWMSQECLFIELGDEFCTGSSLMPQKKNPDMAELSRGKTGRVYGNLIALMTVMKGLPLCYNRDMQEDKEPLFDSIDTVKMVLSIYAPMLQSIKLKEERMIEAASDPLLMATDLVEWLVGIGIPFRTAHHKVGKLVALCQSKGIKLNDLTLEKMKEAIPEATEVCLELFSPEKSVQCRNSTGGTSPEQVKKQISFWKRQLNGNYAASKDTRNRNRGSR